MATFTPTSFTFVLFSYTYVLIALCFKSVVACSKPVFSILDKLYHSKLSGSVLDRPRLPATVVADNDRGYRSGIQGMF